MKKNIEWLKKEIATEMIELEPNRKERWSDVKYQTLRNVAQKINQLDEPEVLSQEESINIVLDDLKEYIKEQQSLSQNVGLAHTSAGNDTHYRQYDYVLECVNEYEPSDDLQNLIIPKQEVLSQEWVDRNKFEVNGWNEAVHVEDLQNLIVPKQEELESKIKVLIEAYKQEEDAYSNPENGWISGFIEDLKNLVEEEQKYYALIKGHELITGEGIWDCRYWNLSTSDGVVFPSNRLSRDDKLLTKMSKEDWGKCGINESNADFVEVAE